MFFMYQAITKFPRLRVLAVQDHLPSTELLESMLLDFSCDYEIVDDGHHAMDLHTLNPFDIIVLDVLAPGNNGPELLNQLKNISGPKSLAHVIALVTNSSQKNTIKWLNHGISHYIEKPLKISDLEKAFLHLVPGKAL